MSDVPNILQKLEFQKKFRLPPLAENKSEQILQRNEQKEIENHLSVSERRLSEIRELLTTVQEFRLNKRIEEKMQKNGRQI